MGNEKPNGALTNQNFNIMAKVKYAIREFTPNHNQTGMSHSLVAVGGAVLQYDNRQIVERIDAIDWIETIEL